MAREINAVSGTETPASNRVASRRALGSTAPALISHPPLSFYLAFNEGPVAQTNHGLPHLFAYRMTLSSRHRRTLASNESEQIRVDLILMCGGDAVRCARVVDFLCPLDELCR